MKAAVMFSGGIDSSTIVAMLVDRMNKGMLEEVRLIAFDDDSTNWRTRRSIAVEHVAQYFSLYDKLHIIRAHNSEEFRFKGTFGLIPGYKMSMQLSCMAVCQKYGIQQLYMGYCKENDLYPYTFKDEQPENIQEIAELYNKIYDADIEIHLPFLHNTKDEIIIEADNLDFPLEKTISCRATRYGGLLHCGTCLPCKSRINGFIAAGIDDPTDYWNKNGAEERVVYEHIGTQINRDK